MPVVDLQQALLSGPRTARELAVALGVSQPTVSRLLARHAHEVVAVGKARATRYALRRLIRDIGSSWPVFRVDSVGEVSAAGELLAIYPAGFVWRDALSGKDLVYEGLPWFLVDNRPQGYLGRKIVRFYGRAALPERLSDWCDDDVLDGLVHFGHMMPGNLLISERSKDTFQQFMQGLQRVITDHQLPSLAQSRSRYGHMATISLRHEDFQSSAGGEQPKLDVLVENHDHPRELLIKFSPPMDQPTGLRWSDLLVAEHLAHLMLGERGIPSAESEIVIQDNRTFLEVTRFDRTPIFGRLGMVSLEAVNNEFVGHARGWDEQAHALLDQRRISRDDYERILRVYAFGHLIANTDMHNGNLSFFLGDDFSLKLAPVYDMLPMYYAPNTHGEVIDRTTRIPRPTPLTRAVWPEVCAWAREYWLRMQNDVRISEEFRRIAQAQRDAIDPET